MKRYKHIQTITMLIATALLASACSKEVGNGGDEPTATHKFAPLGVQVEVAPQTRSVVTGAEFAHGSQINIILHDAGATTKYQGISMPYLFQQMSSDPGVWIPTAPQGLLVSDPADVFAHAPAVLPAYAQLSVDKMSMEVTLPTVMDFGDISGFLFESFYMKLRTTDANATEIFVCRDEADLMVGQGTQVSTAAGGTKETTIAMKHSLAMIVVNIQKAPQLPGNPFVQSIAIGNTTAGAKPLKQGSFSLADNSFTPNATEVSYTRTMSGFSINLHHAMLVCPATMDAGDAEMVLTADQIDYTMPMPAKTWQAGKVYIYNVTIDASEAQLGDVLLADWPAWTEKPFELD